MSSNDANAEATQQTSNLSNEVGVTQGADKSWKGWFLSRESADFINKGAQEALFKAFDSSVDEDKCLEEIECHKETVFMFRQNFGDQRVQLFHHLSSVGGNIYIPNKEFGFIQGIEDSAVCFITPDVKVLSKLPFANAEPIPVVNHLFAATTVDEVNALTNGQQTTYLPRNFIPVPPFLIDSISSTIKDNDGSATMVFLEVVKEIKNFDTAHASDQEYKEKAKQKCKDLLAWLYLVIKDKVQAIPSIGCNSKNMIDTLRVIEEKDLKTSKKQQNNVNIPSRVELESIFKRPLEIMATSSSSTNEMVQKMNSASDDKEKSSKSFKKVAPKYRKMLLVASSQGEVVPSELPQEAMTLFTQSSVLHAQIFLNSILETERINCAITPAMATSLMHGSFLWASSLTPSGLAASVISSIDVFTSDTLHEGIVLDYSTKHEISSASLRKLTKTQILFPNDIESLIERWRALETLVRLFFGNLSPAQQGLRRLVNLCSDNKRLLKTKLYLDEFFIAKVLYTVDDRLNQWLNQCCRVQFVSETNLELVNFGNIIADLQLSQFHCTLPPNIAKIFDNTDLKDKPAEKEESVAKKRKVQSSQIKNNAMVKNWKLRVNERWDNVFKNKSKESPLLSVGSKLCLKYHVKGICYSDCPFSSSHCVLIDEDKTKGETFIKSLQGE